MKISKKQRSPFKMVLPFQEINSASVPRKAHREVRKNEATILSADQSPPSCVLPCAL